MTTPPAQTTEQLPWRAFALAIGIGFLAAAGGSVLLEIVHLGQRLFYEDIPDALGWNELPVWWIGAMLLVGALVVVIAQRLPGGTGASPHTESDQRSEFFYGRFMRTLTLPSGSDEKNIKASYRDGILEVSIPMREPSEKAHSIAVSRAD